MPKGQRPNETDDNTVLFVRGMPRELQAKMKAAAALHRKSLSQYIRDLFEAHIEELERKGVLSKGKGVRE